MILSLYRSIKTPPQRKKQGVAMDLSETFLQHFAEIKDPRVDNHNRRHELIDILVITILGTICGADGWNERRIQPIIANLLETTEWYSFS